MVARWMFDWVIILYDILPESGLIYKYLVKSLSFAKFCRKTAVMEGDIF